MKGGEGERNKEAAEKQGEGNDGEAEVAAQDVGEKKKDIEEGLVEVGIKH